MADELIFSRAVEADLPAVVDLCMQVEEQHENYWPLRWQRRPGIAQGYLRWMTRRINDPAMLIEVAKDPALPDSPVVAMILVTINDEIPIYTYTQFALIQDMKVRATHQRRGIAQHMLHDAAAWAKQHNLTQLRLMVADQNSIAQATFRKAGFKPTYHEMILPLADAP